MFRRSTKPSTVKDTPRVPLAPGKQAYEARRAAKAGVSLERWMADKQKRAQSELDTARKARVKAQARKPGLMRRLLERAHKPL